MFRLIKEAVIDIPRRTYAKGVLIMLIQIIQN
jgi:hypothetical protein